MTFRELLPSWLGGAKRGSVAPIPFHPTISQSFGPGIGNQPTHAALLQENLGVADMATRAIANRISTLNPLVKVERSTGGGTTVDEQLDDHPLKMLLDRPHPDFSRSQLLRLTAQWIVTVGEAYWLKVGSGLQVPVELHPIPPGKVFPVLLNGVVTSYTVTDGDGKQFSISRDEAVRFYFPDPENIFGSEGYLGPAGVTADSLKFAGQHLRSHYETDATPTTVLKALEGADGFDQDEKERFYTLWRQHYHSRVGMKRGIPAILPTNYDLVTLAVQSGADIVPLLEHWRDEQLMGFGVPRSILGQVVSGDRSSAETNQYVFDLHTVSPIASLIEEGITLQLASDFDPSLFVEFEPFVSDDKRFNLEQETSDLNGKVRSVNQVREDRGLDPVEWGEEPVGKIGEMPYDPDSLFSFGSDNAEAIEDEEPPPEEEEERKRIAPARSAAETEWLRQVAREKAYVPSFQGAFMKVLGLQEREVIRRLRAAFPRSRVSADQLFNPEEWIDLFEQTTEPIRRRAFEAIMTETLGGLGIDEFVMTEEMTAVLRHQGALMVKHTGRTTQNLIARQLEAAVSEGEGVDQIAKRIKSVFRLRRGQHAPTIARTEILKASQESQLQSFQIAGVEAKQWNTSMDAAVRDSHAYAEGQIRAVGEPFDLAGEPAQAPGIGIGGSQLSAANAINCRCFLTPVAQGGEPS
jgi:phage portal protein BeeE